MTSAFPPQHELLPGLRELCPRINDELLQDFLVRMDPDYFVDRPLPAIAQHAMLLGQLDSERLTTVDARGRGDGLIDVTVVAYDYFSVFAIICGLLSAFGLDIREGRIYTFSDLVPPWGPTRVAGSGAQASRSSRTKSILHRKKILDLFVVKPVPGVPFGSQEQCRLADALEEMIRLLDAGRLADARRQVNRRLVESLGRSRTSITGLLNPIQITFDNVTSPTDTLMDIRSTDTPAFLYAFASALALRGLYIRKASFENLGRELHDRFYVRGRHGQKIDTPHEQQELRVTAALIKQFTHFLRTAPDPAKAMEAFDQFLYGIFREAREGQMLRFLKDQTTLASLAKLFGTSEFLWEDVLRRQYENLLPMLDQYQAMPLVRSRTEIVRQLKGRLRSVSSDEKRRRVLNQYKDEELFRIDMKHLLDPSTTLQDFSAALTDLAETVLGEAADLCLKQLARALGRPRLSSGEPCGFGIFGMGKFGGRELGYASDIEVLFVYEGPGETQGRQRVANSEFFERLVQEILQWIEAKQEGIFHLDVRLRPHGSKGLLANTLSEIQHYYSPAGLCAPFERQALIKLRHVWGDAALGETVESHRDTFVYSSAPWNIQEAVELRRQQVKEFVEPEQTNVKYSPGGLLDVEYAIQYLQLLHGHQHPQLRTPNTLTALGGLTAVRLLPPDEARILREGYLFLRRLIDALRIVRGHAKDLVLPPVDSEAFVFLARRLGYWTDPWQEGAARLATAIEETMTGIARFFNRRFGGVLAHGHRSPLPR